MRSLILGFDAFKSAINNIIVNRHTYCHYMWQSVYIYYNGDVFICCHNKPAKIGNINSQSLQDIWLNSKKLKVFRLMSRFNCLNCFNSCNIITENQKKSKFDSEKYPYYPKVVWLNCGELCNIRCIMCPQDHHSNVSLDFQILKNNINWQDVQEIVLQGGEVLAQNSGKELFLHLTQQLNKKVDIVTNGTLIDERWADFLVQGCNTVVISVNAATKAVHEKINVGSDYDKVINNIFKLINLKRLYNSHVKIKFRFTIVPENIEEIADAIILSSDLGCDQIQFGYDISTIAYLKENLKIKNELYKKISSILKVENMDKYVDVSRLQYLGLL